MTRTITKFVLFREISWIALATVTIIEHVLAGKFSAGFQTPSKVSGLDLVLEIKGVEREDGE